MPSNSSSNPAADGAAYSRNLAALRDRIRREQQRADVDVASAAAGTRAAQPSSSAGPTDSPTRGAEARLPPSLRDRLDAHRRATGHTPPRTSSPHRTVRDQEEDTDILASIVAAEAREAKAAGAGSPFPETKERLLAYVAAERALQLEDAPSSPPFPTTTTASRSRGRNDDDDDGRRPPSRRSGSSSSPQNTPATHHHRSTAATTSPPPPDAEANPHHRQQQQQPSASSSHTSSPTRRGRFLELLQETERLSALVGAMEVRHAEDEEAWHAKLVQEQQRTREAAERIAVLEAAEDRLMAEVARLEAEYKTRATADSEPANANPLEQRALGLKTKEIEHLRGMLERCEQRVEALESEAADREAIMAMQDEELRRAERAAEAAAAATTTVEDRAEADLAEVRAELAGLTADKNNAARRAQEAEAALETAQGALASLAASVASPPRHRANTTSTNPNGSETSPESGDELAVAAVSEHLLRDLETVRAKSAKLQAENADLSHRTATANVQLSTLATRVAALERERDAAKVSLEDALAHTDRLKATISSLQKDVTAAERLRAKESQDALERGRAADGRIQELEETLRLRDLHIATAAAESHERAKEAEKTAAATAEAVRQVEAAATKAAAERDVAQGELEAANARAADYERRCADLSRQIDDALRSVEAEQERAMTTERTMVDARGVHTTKLAELRRAIATAERRSEGAEADLAAANEALASMRKQRDVAVERASLQKATAKAEVDSATAAGRAQLRQLAHMLERREEEAAGLRERVSVLEAANRASAHMLTQQQQSIDELTLFQSVDEATTRKTSPSRPPQQQQQQQRSPAVAAAARPRRQYAEAGDSAMRPAAAATRAGTQRSASTGSRVVAPPPPPTAIRHGSASVASSIPHGLRSASGADAGSEDSSVARVIRREL